MKLGKNIRIIRDARSYSRDYMATHLNVSLSTYSKIERDESKINEERLNHLAQILGVTSDCIITVCDEILQISNGVAAEKENVEAHSKSESQDESIISKLINQVDKLINQNQKLVGIIENNIS